MPSLELRKDTPIYVRSRCPRCGKKLIYRTMGTIRWRACPSRKRCGWSVLTHGDDPRDKRGL